MPRIDDEAPMTAEEAALAERGAALIALAMVQPEARAPHSLREAVDRAATARPAQQPRFGLTRGRLLVAGAGLCVALVALVFALGGNGGAGGPTVAQVAAAGRLPARQGPPAPTGGSMPRLAAEVQGLAFPDWTAAFGWTATGERSDRVGGRAVTTVFYADAKGAALGYSIVEGAPIGGAPAGADVQRGATRFRVARRAGRTTVTWTQSGRTCVIDAPSTVPDAKLVLLASWDVA